MKNLSKLLIPFLAGNLAVCGCYNHNNEEEMQEQICELKEKIEKDSLAYSNLKEENKKIMELCKKRKKERKISYNKIEVRENRDSLKKDENYAFEKPKIDSNYNFQRENKQKIHIPDSISLIQENEKVNKNFLAFISVNGEYDFKRDGTRDENKIGYFKRVNFKNISVSFVKEINLKVIVNHMEPNWEIWNDENADGKMDSYGKNNLTEREEPFENFPLEKQKEISRKLINLKAEIMEDAGWRY